MPAKVATFVSQIDQHAPCLTKLLANKVDAIMKVFGIDHVADTIVGDALRRGVSGGQRRRVTVAEMVMGAHRLICGDEITTGLDSQTAYELVHAIAAASKVFRKTSVLSLLQPPPEVFDCFDALLFATFAAVMPSAAAAQPAAGLTVVLCVLFSGFVIARDNIPVYWLFFYCSTSSTTARLGHAGVGVLAGYFLVFAVASTVALDTIRHGSAGAPSSGDDDDVDFAGDDDACVRRRRRSRAAVHAAVAAAGSAAHKAAETRARNSSTVVPETVDAVASSLPFEPAALSFHDGSTAPKQRSAYVRDILDLLELGPVARRLVGSIAEGGLSFEQRKRLTMAVEMAANPAVLFLDEPTSAVGALFLAFDRLLLLKKGGKMVYFGELGEDCAALVSYLSDAATSLGAGLPPLAEGQNPATWMLTAADPDADFADFYKFSPLAKANEAEVLAALEGSAPTRNPLLGGGLEAPLLGGARAPDPLRSRAVDGGGVPDPVEEDDHHVLAVAGLQRRAAHGFGDLSRGRALPDEASAQAIGPSVSSLFSLFSGFVIAPAKMPSFWMFMYWISPCHYFFEGLVVTQFHGVSKEVVVGAIPTPAGPVPVEVSLSTLLTGKGPFSKFNGEFAAGSTAGRTSSSSSPWSPRCAIVKTTFFLAFVKYKTV
ncbi:ABC transporter [Aureococcus anophagefferens]|uniref:ABC transporter n=1 Tax=Aureococcus anophagefferens TaxID=44056 RepID=A0ABR1G0T8_AURAN